MRNRHATNWNAVSRVAPDDTLTVRIGLTQSNLNNAAKYVADVSDPDSPNYGKHWSAAQVQNVFAPSDETVTQVRSWLVESGIDSSTIAQSDTKGWLAFQAPASRVESLLGAEYYNFQEMSSGNKAVACDLYHVPAGLQEHIDYVVPGVIMKAPVKRNHIRKTEHKKSNKETVVKRANNGSSPLAGLDGCSSGGITPTCVAALYGIPSVTTVHDGNALGIYEALDRYSQDSLDAFYKQYAPYIPQGTHPTELDVDGALNGTLEEEGESDLDFQLAYPIIYPQNISLFQTNEGMNDGFFNIFLDAIDGVSNIPPSNLLTR